MKKFLFCLLALAVGMVAVPASVFAASGCGANQKLEIIGTSLAGDGVITTVGASVRLILVNCTSSACVAGLYDSDTVDTALAPKIEIGAGASGFDSFPQSGFLQVPLQFNEGISFQDDGNVLFIALYECVEK